MVSTTWYRILIILDAKMAEAIPTQFVDPEKKQKRPSFPHHRLDSFSSFKGWHIHFHHDEAEGEHEEHHWHIADLELKERIRHFTWSWYTMTMATGGIANVL